MISFNNSWDQILEREFRKDYYRELRIFLDSEYDDGDVYPEKRDIFNAYKLTPLNDAKAVVIGQDPYHQPHQAHGLSFSVKKGVDVPPSLRNIFKEIHREYGTDMPSHGDLHSWAKQGVMLLNAVLTVRRGEPNSHKSKGWELLTDATIRALSECDAPIVFMLWGNDARKKSALIDSSRNCVLEASHPSPLAANRGFFGCGHFLKANEYLIKNLRSPIEWWNL